VSGSETTITASATSRRVAPSIVLGLLGSLTVAILGTVVGSIPASGVTWWFHVPAQHFSGRTVLFDLGVAALLGGWLGLGGVARRGELSIRSCWVALLAWGTPLFLGPPLYSRDLYSYVAQGIIARRGLNPYTTAPDALGPGQVLNSVASVWRHTPSPYGPVFVGLSHLTGALSGDTLVRQILTFRVLGLIGVLALMMVIPRLARRLGTNPGMALWLSVISPLALLGYVSSGHNESLMMAFLLAGILLAVEGLLSLGLGLTAFAAAIKLPALAAPLMFGAKGFVESSPAQRPKVIAKAAGVPLVVLALVTLAMGYGFTWLGPKALKIPTELHTLITPSVMVGVFVASILHVLGSSVPTHSVVSVIQSMFSFGVVAGVVFLVIRIRSINVVRGVGLVLMLVAVGSPTLWPWYLLWGLTVLAVTSAQTSKALAATAGLAMFLTQATGTPILQGHSYLLTGPLVIAGILWFLTGGRWRKAIGL